MSENLRSIGIIGFGQIGSYIYDQVTTKPGLGLRIAFVYDTDPGRTRSLPSALVLDRLEGFEARKADMICEVAHPDVTKRYGLAFLAQTDYFVLSVTALADRDLAARLQAAAVAGSTRLFVPHGGVMGLETIIEGRETWEDVTFVMKKNPANLDFAQSGIDPTTIKTATIVYDGPTGGICPKFPRNVNTHACVALAGIGFDRTRSILIADPALQVLVQEIRVRGGGVEFEFKLTAQMKGVTGSATLRSVLASIVSTAVKGPGLHFC